MNFSLYSLNCLTAPDASILPYRHCCFAKFMESLKRDTVPNPKSSLKTQNWNYPKFKKPAQEVRLQDGVITAKNATSNKYLEVDLALISKKAIV